MNLPPVQDVAAKILALDALGHEVLRVRLQLDADVERLAGQYLEIIDGGRAYAFSIASPPESGRKLELHVRHGAANPASLEVVALLRRATPLQLRLPQGDCVLAAEPQQPLLLVAGATGFSQVQAFVEHALARRWSVPTTVCWGARRPEDFYVTDLPLRWQREHAHIRCHFAVSQGAVPPGMHAGVAHEVAMRLVPDFTRHRVYACGSPPMVYAARDALTAAGLPPARFFSDVLAWAPQRERRE